MHAGSIVATVNKVGDAFDVFAAPSREDPHRQRTIIRTVESIVKSQLDFFDNGVAYLRPLRMCDVAADIGMHESTVSRAIAAKCVRTPHGVFELKYFFSAAIACADGEIATRAVKSKIQELVAGEDPEHPYSDQRIVELLSGSGITIARRTVAKYRDELGIPSSRKRRKQQH